MGSLQGSYRASSQQAVLPSRILCILVGMPLCLATFAFVLQWRGGEINDLILVDRWEGDTSKLPGGPEISLPPNTGRSVPSSSPSSSLDCPKHVLSRSSDPTFPYVPGWQYHILNHTHPKICICTSTSAGLNQILPWLFYHQAIGVTNFFLFVEGKAASTEVSVVLESIPGVKVIYRTKELEEKQATRFHAFLFSLGISVPSGPFFFSSSWCIGRVIAALTESFGIVCSRVWNESWLSTFFYRPCNYELFVKQTLNMEMAIILARESGMEWIIHLDTDELFHPAGGREYSLRAILKDVEADVDIVVFPNYESAIERDDIEDPFTEVSMFKKNYDHVPKELYFGLYREVTRGNPNYFLTYGNGKSAARVQDHLRPNGVHRWHNYMKIPKEIKHEDAAVLHYTYTRFSDVTSRRNRCGCKPTKDDVRRCFMLEFDRAAFIIASTSTEEEMRRWYVDRVVWTDKELLMKLTRNGLFTRIYAPMVILQGLRESGIFHEFFNPGQGQLEKTQPKQTTLSMVNHSPDNNNNNNKSSLTIMKPNVATNPEVDKNQNNSLSSKGGMQATLRKLLDTKSIDRAMPPLPTPGIEFFDGFGI